MEFYRISAEEAVSQLATSAGTGLTSAEAATRLASHGENRIRRTHSRNPLSIFMSQFKDLLVIILVVAGCISLYMGDTRDAFLMFAIVLANATIRFYQEYKSERIIESLKSRMTGSAKVVRGGDERIISATHLVPGDIVLLEEGDGVPADLRLIESENFATNDFILTGEQSPQPKRHDLAIAEETPVTDRDNCVFEGVTVARGRARGVVFATGMDTEVGKIARTSEEVGISASPLQLEIADLARKITRIALAVTAMLFIGRLFTVAEFRDALVFAVGVAAAMVPEGMPAQISVALSMGVRRLARQNAVAKKLSAIETLGASTVIATDKTGTITKNELTINNCHFGGREYFIFGTGYEPAGEVVDDQGAVCRGGAPEDVRLLFLCGFLASTGRVHPPDEEHRTWYSIGDPTESAFATLALKAGAGLDKVEEEFRRVEVFAFDSARKRMSVVRESNGRRMVFAKGAPEQVLDVCTHIADRDGVRPIDGSDRRKVLSLCASHAHRSLRVIAVAYKESGNNRGNTLVEAESGLVFGGFATMLDPPHYEVRRAVERAFAAHIKVMMITGDDAVTALSVAHAIGMKTEDHRLPEVVESRKLAAMDDAAVMEKLAVRTLIFSRVSPADKLRIVELLKKRGEVVAVTGDGVNDTLSLKRADIGVAMGLKGAETAKEAADLVLLDDNFSTIVSAIREGRTIYRNLGKTITSSLTSNFGELSCVLIGFGGGVWGLPIPIMAVQILAVDLIGEMLPLTFLTLDPPEHALMRERPRDLKRHIVDRGTLFNIVAFGALMGALAYFSFFTVYGSGLPGPDPHARGMAGAYATIVFCQFMNIISRRTARTVFTGYFFSNGHLLSAFFLSLAFVLLIVNVPLLNVYFHTAPLLWHEWFLPVGGAAVFLAVHELRKYWLGYPGATGD